MDVRCTEKHEREVYVGISRNDLEGLILAAVAEKIGVDRDLLRKHGKIDILPNMEGSPQYKSGYRANFRATIPIAALEPAAV